MALDVLATRLQTLLDDGCLPASQLSDRMRARLDPLFRVGALVEEHQGRGKRVELKHRESLERWIGSNYPSGLLGTDASLPARAESAANFRNTKRGRALEAALVHMRGFSQCRLIRGPREQPLAAMTAAFGVAGVVIDPADPWQLSGTLGVVENLELFMQIERVVPALDAALWAAGRLANHVLSWLGKQDQLRVVHFGDYDPVGLSEYLRLRATLGERVRFYVPPDFEERLSRFGQRELLVRSADLLAGVRRRADESVRQVLAVIERHGLGLEHESILIPLSSSNCEPDSDRRAVSDAREEPCQL